MKKTKTKMESFLHFFIDVNERRITNTILNKTKKNQADNRATNYYKATT